MRALRVAAALAAASALTVASVRVADACGCVSPPVPDPLGKADYAVNQLAEQIIFEVEQNWVTAHVLIKYAGDPDKFAWIVPVPEAPELGLSPVSAFALLDRATAPDVGVDVVDLCPVSEWACRYHPAPRCGGGGGGCGDVSSADDGFFADAAGADGASGGGGEPVTVLGTEVVGDYETVTFRASEAAAAAQWLRDNGFIVNETTTLYMEPYVEANMVFVAARLVPGAGVNAIKPLRMRFRAPFPMIPLVLTAVAAEPHLTVTAFVYGTQAFRPLGHPVVTIDPARIAQDRDGRGNYPMVLARTVDEAGGDGFVVEYRGPSPRPTFGGQASFCCDQGWDLCSVGNNQQCECPRDEFDRADCEAVGDVLEGVAFLDGMTARHAVLTRITTRLSPEEMRFDPTFGPDAGASLSGLMVARGTQPNLDRCWTRVLDEDAFRATDTRQDCAAVYCGAGACVTTEAGAGCDCDPGHVARRFIDLDGLPSVTCIPAAATVDLGAGGLPLPDACAEVSCGQGQCRDRNGIPVCECAGGAAAVAGPLGPVPTCVAVETVVGGPGAEDYSEPLRGLAVCAPPPPACLAGGWYERVASPRVGIDCGDAAPAPELLEAPPAPTCGGLAGMYGCGCHASHPAGALALAWIVGFLLLRRRRRPT
ncbi:MAG: DUF2330 domain-containing protein [Myxococcales bacterium]|nr:DUF2330 domain-containing protein [Myxococcales bacterium]